MYQTVSTRLFGKIVEQISGEKITDVLLERKAYNYLIKYVKNCKAYSFEKKQKINKTVIWVCWLQGFDRAPIMVKSCLESIRKNTSFEVIEISEQNIKEFVDIPDFIEEKYKKKEISNAHYADIVRLILLSCYGGCWIDSTVFCLNEVPTEWIETDLFMFRVSKYGREFKYAANWWLACVENNYLIGKVRDVLLTYWENENKVIDYYIFHKILHILVNSDDEIKRQFKEIDYYEVGHCHVLDDVINDTYSLEKLKKITKISPIQKLNHHKKIINDSSSFYSKIIKEGNYEN